MREIHVLLAAPFGCCRGAALVSRHTHPAGGVTLAHDILDRLDGAVARSNRIKESPGSHDGNFGAFLDAQIDKVRGGGGRRVPLTASHTMAISSFTLSTICFNCFLCYFIVEF